VTVNQSQEQDLEANKPHFENTMQISNFVLFGVIELYIVLIAVCIYLIMHARSLKKLVKRLQDKLEGMIGDVKSSRRETKNLREQLDNSSPAELARKLVNDQIQYTRDHHDSLEAGQNIALDLGLDNPLPRRTAALRHAILIAEKESLHASPDGKPNWNILELKLDQLLQFFNFKPKDQAEPQAATDPDALANLQQELEASQKRIENLEKFKKLFFDMEDQWRSAKDQADDYFQQLSGMAGEVSNQDAFEDILSNYNNVYNQVGETIEIAAGGDRPKPGAGDTIIVEANRKPATIIEVNKADPNTLNELKQLRSVAADQHKIIAELQRKLTTTTSSEEKANMVAELSEQLTRQARFVQESETCMKLLEDELDRSMQEASALREESGKVPKLQALVQQFSTESKEMLETITRLENENEQLEAQALGGENTSGDGAGQSGIDPDSLAQLQQQLLDAQSQYAELEERYLDLKMQNI